MSFNIKGLFKQRFYHQAYMTVSMIMYEVFLFYLLFINNVSNWFPFMKPFNDFVRLEFMVNFFKI